MIFLGIFFCHITSMDKLAKENLNCLYNIPAAGQLKYKFCPMGMLFNKMETRPLNKKNSSTLFYTTFKFWENIVFIFYIGGLWEATFFFFLFLVVKVLYFCNFWCSLCLLCSTVLWRRFYTENLEEIKCFKSFSVESFIYPYCIIEISKSFFPNATFS